MMIDSIVQWLRLRLAGRPAILGLSGGVDSAVVAYLLAQAIPIAQIQAFILPTATNVPSDQADAESVAEALHITVTTISLEPLLATYQAASADFSEDLPLMNLKARIRMSLLYGRANRLGGLVVGTGNKSELLTGYFTKYGDGGVDLLPIGGLYKTEVWDLAKALGVSETIITKAPSAGLFLGQTDEAELGMSYVELDAILQASEQGAELTGFSAAQVARATELKRQAAHKLVTAPIPTTKSQA